MDTLSRRVIHRGRKFDFEVLTVRTESGSVIEREVVRHPGAVVIVPILNGHEVVLIRNRRVAIGTAGAGSGGGEWLLECPAGTLEANEDPAACAGRELVEETGYEAATITPLGWFYTTPGLTDEKMHAFAATGLTFVGQRLEEDESIRVETHAAADIIGMIDACELRDAKSIIALLKASRARMI